MSPKGSCVEDLVPNVASSEMGLLGSDWITKEPSTDGFITEWTIGSW